MTDVVAGIKEEELRALSVEILGYRDYIKTELGKIDGAMKSLSNYYQGSPCDKILKRYDTLSDQYQNLGSNLKNYAKDLQTVIKMMHAGDKRLTFLLNRFESEIQQEAKSNKEVISQNDINYRRSYTWQKKI